MLTEDSITLPNGVEWPDLQSSKLYIRSFYRPLWESALCHGLGELRGAAILGTPGSELRGSLG